MIDSPAPVLTPKRKRSELLTDDIPVLNLSSRFSFGFGPPPSSPVEDGSSSPRSRVAHRFRGLALRDDDEDDNVGGIVAGAGMQFQTHREPSSSGQLAPAPVTDPLAEGITESGDTMHEDKEDVDMDTNMDTGARKRVKLTSIHHSDEEIGSALSASANAAAPSKGNDTVDIPAPKTSASRFYGALGVNSYSRNRPFVPIAPRPTTTPVDNSSANNSTSSTGSTSGDSTSGSDASKSRKQRPGTPPLKMTSASTSKGSTTPDTSVSFSSASSTSSSDPDSPPAPPTPAGVAPSITVTDSLRASLTWHEDEITIYDPDDSDDDGTGINGIGFKPTPAIAYARTLKRKQQLAEYRKREEREARSRRNQRRRGGSSRGASPAGVERKVMDKDSRKKEERRRVRFLEIEIEGGVMKGEKVVGTEAS